MAAGHHTDDWFRAQNAATGQPPGARHSDKWYADEIARRQAEAAGQATTDHNASLQQLYKEQQNQTYYNQQAAQQAAQNQQQAAAQAQAQAAAQAAHQATAAAQQQAAQQAATAAHAEVQRKEKARRDDWDRMNKQGAYDPDGWQSMGYQPDPIPMPEWWDGVTSAPGATAPPPATTAASTAQPWTKSSGPKGAWGAWGQTPRTRAQPTGGGAAPAWGGGLAPDWTRNRTRQTGGGGWAAPAWGGGLAPDWTRNRTRQPGAWGSGSL